MWASFLLGALVIVLANEGWYDSELQSWVLTLEYGSR